WVDSLKKRSIKRESKLWALDLAIRMMDLTTLEGKDTPGKIRALCAKAIHPQPGDPTIPSVAAVCVYPALVEDAKEALKGSTVKVASVATGFPSGQTFRDIKVAETRAAAPAGGVRVAKEAIQYLVVLYETLGPRWMSPDWFRFGASSLLNDVLMQIEKERTGRYQGPDHFTID